MEIELIRSFKSNEASVGILNIDGKFECFTCEDMDRGLKQTDHIEKIKAVKIPAKTAIPTGRYQVVITMSNRFKKPLPLLLDVPGFAGIRIHAGNTANDSEGCILPGTDHTATTVINSRAAFNQLFTKISEAKEKVFITIS